MATLATRIRLNKVETKINKRQDTARYKYLTPQEKRFVKLHQEYDYYRQWYNGRDYDSEFAGTPIFRGDCVFQDVRNALNIACDKPICKEDWERLEREHNLVCVEFERVHLTYEKLRKRVRKYNFTDEQIKDIKARMKGGYNSIGTGGSFTGGYGFIKDITEEIITFNAKQDDKKVVENAKSLSIIDLLELDDIMHESVLQENVEMQDLASFLGV